MTTNHLTPAAELQLRRDAQRAMQALDRALRRKPEPVATDSEWGAVEVEQRNSEVKA